MNRRQLLSMTAAGAALQLPSLETKAAAASSKRALMKLGCQSGPTSDQRLQFFKRHSVNNICGYPEDSAKQGLLFGRRTHEAEGAVREAQA